MLQEHASAKYAPRTVANAKSADLTVAFAVDFSTAGEALTRKSAGDAYIGITLGGDHIQAARALYRELRARSASKVNVAGNGIYTLAGAGWTQHAVNVWVSRVIRLVAQHWPIQSIRSGVQTGVDLAGLVAAGVVGVDAIGLLPNGFLQRGADGVDRQMTEEAVRDQVMSGVAAVIAELQGES